MEIEIISKECIKPSSPTPPNLKTYKLSLLDQVHSSIYIPVILFYPMNQSISHDVVDIVSQRSQLLKQSLSETLTRFYPLAGKVKDDLSIDCNDEGVLYLEAYANCHLVDYLNQPNLASLQQFLPQQMTFTDPVAGDYVAMTKVTSFACGGFAIGILVCHMVADGTAFSAFLNGWAATARKASEAVCPNFDAPSIFVQSDAFSKEAAMTTFAKAYKSDTERTKALPFVVVVELVVYRVNVTQDLLDLSWLQGDQSDQHIVLFASMILMQRRCLNLYFILA
ncbi:stemmadenine O-acetyltransferase-like [Alnus glutinosa]|uniref:stemmadenine O-acetyltransferase-like n=1 Tax=Alnus glutinosa TaxID=3517 RepID=UPI002D786AD2|nr:stemmadenine O-acetyltransferase-like [Alnus glutinosa]